MRQRERDARRAFSPIAGRGVRGLRAWTRRYLPVSSRDALLCVVILSAAALLCVLLRTADKSDVYVSMIFLLAVLITARVTRGYLYGIVASFAGVVLVNYVFTYPYFAFNFTISGYPLTFISMLVASLTTSAMTTQIKEQERIRREAEMEKMRGNLLRAVSHDLRTPLTSIIGSSSAILDGPAALPPQAQRRMIEDIREDAEGLLRMVENLLSITRINGEAARIKAQPEAVEEVVAESVRKFKKRFPALPVSIRLPDEMLMARMDPILIEQVIVNLLENVVMHAQGASRAELTVERRGDACVLSVLDDGCGIPQSAMPHLFDGYLTRAEHPLSDATRSMGIGLSVCMSIVRAHGGTLRAENRPSGGAALRFTLPIDADISSPQDVEP